MSDSAFSAISIEKEHPLTWLVLNRPETLNAMNQVMLTELSRGLAELAEDDGTSVIAIRGAGRAFSSGYDIRGGADGTGYGANGEGYVRISLTVPDDLLAEAMERVARTIGG